MKMLDPLQVQAVQAVEPVNSLSTSNIKQAGPEFSLDDIGKFQEVMNSVKAQSQVNIDAFSTSSNFEKNLGQGLLDPLKDLNNAGNQLYKFVESMRTKDDLMPSDIAMLTFMTHDFGLRTELTSNIANKSSDGIQQLFRQQS
jgi:hypothetical protein